MIEAEPPNDVDSASGLGWLGKRGVVVRVLAAPSSLGRDFDRFLVASAVSNLGDGIRLGAFPLLALSFTSDARLISLVVAAGMLPWLLLGPIGGAIVDRADRRRLMVMSQLTRGALVAVLLIAMAAEVANIWWLVVVGFGLGAGEILVDTSSQAAVPMLVPENLLDRANARLIAAITLLDNVIGVALGALLFTVFTELPFLVDAATFVIGAVVIAGIQRPLQGDRPPAASASVRADIVEGGRFLLKSRFLRGTMIAVTLSNVAGNIGFGVFVLLVVDEIGAPEAAFGVVLGVGAIGGVLGSLSAGRIVERFGRRRVMGVLPFVLALTHCGYAVATETWMISVSFFVASFTIVCFNVPGQSLRQSATPEPLLGRVIATWRMFGMGLAPFGAILGGLITAASGVRNAMWVAATVEVVAGVALLAALRHLDGALADRNAAVA